MSWIVENASATARSCFTYLIGSRFVNDNRPLVAAWRFYVTYSKQETETVTTRKFSGENINLLIDREDQKNRRLS